MTAGTAPAYLHKLHAALVANPPGQQRPYRVTFTGSRDPIEHDIWRPVVRDLLQLLTHRTRYPGLLRISHGASFRKGIDHLVDQEARRLHLDVQRYPVNAGEMESGRYGPFLRNARMLNFERPDLVVGILAVLPSHGTAHCLATAEEWEIPTVRVTFEDVRLHLPVVAGV